MADDRMELAAQAIYEKMPFDDPGFGVKPKWVPGGNSDKQYEARKYAKAALLSAPATPSEGLVDGDDTFTDVAKCARAIRHKIGTVAEFEDKSSLNALHRLVARGVAMLLEQTLSTPATSRPEQDDWPDQYCITRPDGECVSTDPRCMHQAASPLPVPEEIKRITEWVLTTNGTPDYATAMADFIVSLGKEGANNG